VQSNVAAWKQLHLDYCFTKTHLDIYMFRGTYLGKNKNLGHRSRQDLEPRMTVLATARRNLNDGSIDRPTTPVIFLETQPYSRRVLLFLFSLYIVYEMKAKCRGRTFLTNRPFPCFISKSLYELTWNFVLSLCTESDR
jgi:hypothetical protein